MLPQVRKILYCTDLSETAVNALRYAVFLAKSTGAQIHILHVVGELSEDAKVALKGYIQDPKSLDNMLRDRSQHSRKEIARRLDLFWATADEGEKKLRDEIVSVDVTEGYPVEIILKKAEDEGADMIVMGTHEKGFAQSFLGSVAKTVLRSAKVPVVVVPLPAL